MMSAGSLSPRSLAGGLQRLLGGWFQQRTAGLLILAVGVGSISGLLSVSFWHAIRFVNLMGTITLYERVRPVLDPGSHWLTPGLWITLLPATGALLMALLVHAAMVSPANPGVATVMLDARTSPGNLPLRYVPAAFFAAALIIGSGGSAGREAPVVAMGGIIGGWAGRWLGLTKRRREILIGCGAAAAIAAAYNAPLAGVFFALELVLGDYTAGTLSPVVLASVAGTSVCRSLEGTGASHFVVPPYHIAAWWEIALYAGLGLAAGLVAPLFVVTDRGIHRFFDRLKRVPPILKPMLGGLAVGGLAFVLPQVMGNGYSHVQEALAGRLTLTLLVALVFGKILATGLTLGSGGWGGDFAPLLFIGAMLGGAYGAGMDHLIPQLDLTASSYAMVGMGALLTAAVRCPITAILLLFELTGSYQVILPMMTAVAVAIPVSRIFLHRGMYHEQMAAMGGPSSELHETRLLETIPVAQVMQPQAVTLAAGAPYREILRVIATSTQLVFPVLDGGGRLLGALTFQTLRGHLDAVELADLIVAADVASEDIPILTVHDALERAMLFFAEYDFEEIPVVTDLEERRFAGILTRRQAMAARARALAEWEMLEE